MHRNLRRRVTTATAGDSYELTAVLIARYNTAPHRSLHGLSPAQHLRQRLDRFPLVRHVPVDRRDTLAWLTFRSERTVRGSVRAGRRPYVAYEGVEYRSEILARSPALIGKPLVLRVNPDDLRVVRAFFADGRELGPLTAISGWGVRPHSLQTRQAILALERQGRLTRDLGTDPIDVYSAIGVRKPARPAALPIN